MQRKKIPSFKIRLGVTTLVLTMSTAMLAGSEGFPGKSTAPPPGVPVEYQGPLPSMAALNIRNARFETLLADLDEPWAIEFCGRDELLLTQIRGRLNRYRMSTRELIPIRGLPKIESGKEQTGLLDIECHPDFPENRKIYFSYVRSDAETGRFYQTVIASAVLIGQELADVRELVASHPQGWSPANFGGALEFDGDGLLFISIGDRSDHIFAQEGQRLEGKILRLKDDGSVPEDNPFLDDHEIDDRIYALGVRNPQGLHYDQVTDTLLEVEHGPLGGDEINIILAGANYGWPTITYGLNYTTEKIGVGTHMEGLRQPIWYYLPSIAASPITVYRGAMFPEWEGDVLIGALKGQHVSKLDLDGIQVRSEHAFLSELGDRIRDIKVHPDGSIYILGQTTGLHRLYRAENQASETPPFDAQLGYDLFCSGCHDTGAASAPLLGDRAAWFEVLKRPRDVVYRRVFAGAGGMPERGLCHICSDEQLKAITDYMLDGEQ